MTMTERINPSVYDHPEYRALLATVLAHPEADLPRLVLADWLEEHDEPERAEFIRVQCSLREPGSLFHDGFTACNCFSSTLGDHVCPLHKRLGELFRPPAIREWFGNDCRLTTSERGFHSGTVPALLIRCGFPAEWRGPLAQWCGGECHTCERGRIVDRGDGGSDRWPCHFCDATGHLTAASPRLVREHPIQTVMLTGAEQYTHFLWIESHDGDGSHRDQDWFLTSDVWHLGDELSGRFESLDDALAALSAAAIRWAKEQPS